MKTFIYPLILWAAIMIAGCGEQTTGTPAHHIKNVKETYIYQTNDTAEINALNKAGTAIAKANADSALNLFRKAVSLSLPINYHNGLAKGYNGIAFYFQEKNNPDLCIQYLHKSIKQNAITGDTTKLLEQYKALAFWLYKTGNYQAIVNLQQEACNILEQNNIQIDKSPIKEIMLGFTATAYGELGNYDSAVFYNYRILTSGSEIDSSNYLVYGETYGRLGILNTRIGDHRQADSMFKIALRIATQYHDSTLTVVALGNTASFKYEQNKMEEAVEVADSALKLARKLKSTADISLNAQTVAIALIKSGKLREALPYSIEGYENAALTTQFNNEISASYVLGYNYTQLGKHQQAIRVLEPALSNASSKNQLDNIANAYGQLAQAYAGLGNWKQAYKHKESYAIMRDSLLGTESAGRIARIESMYQMAQKDKVLARQQVQIERQQKEKFLWIGAFVLLLIMILVWLWNRKSKLKIDKLRASLLGEEKERSRMARELHDGIVSQLSLIKTKFSALPQYSQQEEEAEEFRDVIRQLDQSIIELRTTSHNMLPELLTYTGLENALRTYCEKISKISHLQINFQSIGTLPSLTDDFKLNIYRIIQELIHNIVKHSGASQVLIQFNTRFQKLEITIDDDGKTNDAVYVGTGIGLLNINSRIEYLNGSIEIEKSIGTSVYLEFDLKKYTVKDK